MIEQIASNSELSNPSTGEIVVKLLPLLAYSAAAVAAMEIMRGATRAVYGTTKKFTTLGNREYKQLELNFPEPKLSYRERWTEYWNAKVN